MVADFQEDEEGLFALVFLSSFQVYFKIIPATICHGLYITADLSDQSALQVF